MQFVASSDNLTTKVVSALLFPLVVTNSEKLMMISQGLTIFNGQISRVSCNLLMAGSLIAVIPVLIVAMVLQRRVVEGLTLGAVR